MAEELAEKQAEYYRQVSAKTSANIEDLFNKIIDDLLALSKKKEPAPQNASEGDKSNPQNEVGGKPKEEKGGVKLGSISNNDKQNQGGNCCQK